MAKKKKSKKKDQGSAEKMRSTLHEIYLASLGALATVGEGGAKLAQEATERGRELTKKSKKKGKKKAEEVKGAARETIETMESNVDALGDWVDGRVQAALERLGVPTRNELESVTERLDNLLEKLSKAPKQAATKAKTAVSKVATKAEEAKAEADADDATVYHVTPHDEGWQAILEGGDQASVVTATKKEALDAARDLAKKRMPSRIVVHKSDGTIQTGYSYDDA